MLYLTDFVYIVEEKVWAVRRAGQPHEARFSSTYIHVDFAKFTKIRIHPEWIHPHDFFHLFLSLFPLFLFQTPTQSNIGVLLHTSHARNILTFPSRDFFFY